MLLVICAFLFFFFFNDTATTEIYTLSLHDALPIWGEALGAVLGQIDDSDNERNIAFYSKQLSELQEEYSMTKQEILALVSAI